jgi:hypothetical protein
MAAKYEPLGDHLREQAANGLREVEVTFGTVDRLVGGLPPSARCLRTWWANNSHGQALVWRSAGWHVDKVDLPGQRVVFVTAQVGGSYADRLTAANAASSTRGPRPPSSTPPAAPVTDLAELDTVDASVLFIWLDAAKVTLDTQGKPAFPPLPECGGLYRLTLVSRPGQGRGHVYIGETDNLRRRLAGNYRNPGPSQQTSLRVNALLREHLGAGGVVRLAVTTVAKLRLCGGDEQRLDLTRKAARLAESAALVLAQVTDDADIENLG